MKMRCTTCSLAYAIADGALSGRRVRVRCKRCGETIVFEPAEWHVSGGGGAEGPLTRDEIATRIGSGKMFASTHVWREGFDDWRMAGEVDALVELFGTVTQSLRASAPR